MTNTLRRLVAAFAGALTGDLLVGIVRSHRRPTGRSTGAAEQVLRPAVEILVGVLFCGTAVALWRPLPVKFGRRTEGMMTAGGSAVALAGLAFTWWARRTLGDMYDVSSAAGARLRQNHRLITTGPFAHIRHPMYVGIELASFGALLLYRTWTVVFLLLAFAGLTVRAHREDEILLQEFGDEWRNYAAAVPAWFPRLTRVGSR